MNDNGDRKQGEKPVHACIEDQTEIDGRSYGGGVIDATAVKVVQIYGLTAQEKEQEGSDCEDSVDSNAEANGPDLPGCFDKVYNERCQSSLEAELIGQMLRIDSVDKLYRFSVSGAAHGQKDVLTPVSLKGLPSSPSRRKKRSAEMLTAHMVTNRIYREVLLLVGVDSMWEYDLRMRQSTSSHRRPSAA